MELYYQQYHHLYNRSNNEELVFRSPENYGYFLKKYREYLETTLDTIAYCLMPTHFHFLVYVTSEDIQQIKAKVGILLSSYTKAINKRYRRHGSLFQKHTKAKHIDEEAYLITLATYIHQNPVRSGLVRKAEDWRFSSYQDYIGMRNGTLPKKDLILSQFASVEEFKLFSEQVLEKVEGKYWV
jgi:REP element-mobilizing transposase RayT